MTLIKLKSPTSTRRKWRGASTKVDKGETVGFKAEEPHPEKTYVGTSEGGDDSPLMENPKFSGRIRLLRS